MYGIAGCAFFQSVGGQKMLQMGLLFSCQDAASVTERAVAVHSGQQGLADKFGAVGQLVEKPCQLFIGLEGEDPFLACFHGDSVIFGMR